MMQGGNEQVSVSNKSSFVSQHYVAKLDERQQRMKKKYFSKSPVTDTERHSVQV